MSEQSSGNARSSADIRLRQVLQRLINAGLVTPTRSTAAPAAPSAAPRVPPQAGGSTAAHSAAMQQHVDALLQKIEALQEHTRKLEKQISRSGREQLKTNSLTETQMERLQEALEQLRATDERRESEINTLRQQLREERAAGRLEVVQALFPTLDGLDEALRAGEQLLPAARPTPQESTRPMTVFERLAAIRGDNTRAVAERADLQQKMRAWLEGLTFVRQRLLDVLAAEGVHPIAGTGHPFDPQRHVALEVVPASKEVPPNTVAAELRRGYALDDRIVRYAEVAVAKAQDEQTAQQKTPDEMKGTE